MNSIPHLEKLQKIAAQHPFPLLFATVSGAHLYGFPSPDSDFDLRGVHLLPLNEIVGLENGRETVEIAEIRDGLELDLVTHDAKKFFSLMLKKNGYVLEQVFSPLIVTETPEFYELREIAKKCLTKHHSHHYFGFAETQWKLFSKENPPRVKPLLYIYRVLLTGIYLMQSGEILADLPKLNEVFRLSYIPDLIAQKLEGEEKQKLQSADLNFHEKEYQRLKTQLQNAFENSQLPETTTAKSDLNSLLLKLRLN